MPERNFFFKLVVDVQFYIVSRIMSPDSNISLHMWVVSVNLIKFQINACFV